MSIVRIIILSLFAVFNLSAQDTIHLCVGDNDQNFSVPYSVGSSYQWQVEGSSGIATIISGNGTEHIKIDLNNLGVFKLKVTETNINGCISADSILIKIHDLPQPLIYALGPVSFCQGDSVRLELDSIYSGVIWNNGSTSFFNYADTSGDYFATVTDTNGCINSSSSIVIDLHLNPIVDFHIDGICLRDSTIFTDLSTVLLDSIVSRIWYFGDGEVGNGKVIPHIYDRLGTYQSILIVTSDFGCIDSIIKPVTIFQNPIANFIFSPNQISTIDSIVNFTNQSVNTHYYFWDFDDSTYSILENPTHIFSDPGSYNVSLMVKDSNQCNDLAVQTIVMYYDFILYVPNSFTPDGNGQNDIFGPKGIRMSKYQSYEFKIFNRWGGEVFHTNNIGEQWNGIDAEVGIYTWVIAITDETGTLRKRSGQVRLIK